MDKLVTRKIEIKHCIADKNQIKECPTRYNWEAETCPKNCPYYKENEKN